MSVYGLWSDSDAYGSAFVLASARERGRLLGEVSRSLPCFTIDARAVTED